MKKIILLIATCFFCCGVTANAQQDTLWKYPFIYCYNCIETGVYHDSVLCTVHTTHNQFDYAYNLPLYDTSFTGRCPEDIAVHQYSSDTLRVVGIAFGYVQYANYIPHEDWYSPGLCNVLVSVLDSNMKTFSSSSMAEIESFHDYWPAYYYDSSYIILTVPGKINQFSPVKTDEALKFAFFDEPLDVSGDYYIGLSTINNYTHQPDLSRNFPGIFEYHDPPYHFPNCEFRARYDGVWYDGMHEYFLPELFLIIEPECHGVENVRVMTDTTGCIGVEWDTLRWQTLWVLRLEGPDGTRYDTVDTNHFSYCGLDLNRHYEVSVLTQCYRPGGHNWSDWSNPVSFGSTAINDFENSLSEIEIFPNPANGQVDISSPLPMTQIEVCNALGSAVNTFAHLHSNIFTLDVSTWPAGVYILRIHTPTGFTSKKLLVK